jgi:hypothetical protein
MRLESLAPLNDFEANANDEIVFILLYDCGSPNFRFQFGVAFYQFADFCTFFFFVRVASRLFHQKFDEISTQGIVLVGRLNADGVVHAPARRLSLFALLPHALPHASDITSPCGACAQRRAAWRCSGMLRARAR